MSDDLVKRLRWADFGTETSERNLMIAAAVRIETQAARIAELEAALLSIARNTCCDKCQEAALVARAALERGKE